ncbi:hypothetical protein NDA16_002892 [Ustilago loliicola]|nr:hypothetical protein NDA16_002892 [Ustilago loliicola]
MAAQSDAVALDAQPQSAQSSSQNQPSTSQPRYNPFRRSSGSFSGGGVLARLTSSTSLRAQNPVTNNNSTDSKAQRRPSIGRRISSRSRKSAEGANLAELSKPTGKFKSGIKWDSQQTPEPWMEASDSTAVTAEERELGDELREQAALASGSTAAAQAHANSRGLGTPIFGNPKKGRDAIRSGSPKNGDAGLPTVSQTISAIGSSGIHPEILAGISSSNTSTMQSDSPETVDVVGQPSGIVGQEEGAMSGGDGATPSLTPPPAKSREPSQSEQGGITGDNHMVARAAQLVLEAARQQARVETRKKGKSAPASPKRIGASLSPISTNTAADEFAAQATTASENTDQLERSPSQRGRSKSDAGEETQVKRRKSFLRSMGSRSRRNKSDSNGNGSEDGSETPTPSSNSLIAASATSSGTVTPGGRRRRYVDTRDLDLLARELAAEAIAEQIPQPPFARASRSGSSSPLRSKAGAAAYNDPRRRSFPSILEDAPLQDDSITPVSPTMSGIGLKPMTPLHGGRPNGRPRRGDMAGIGAPGLPVDPTNGMVPKEMFLGLGGSPYPSLPAAAAAAGTRSTGNPLDTMDPFGIPLTQEPSPFDATMAYANKTHVYHTPSQVAVSRSLSGASTWSASQTSPNGSTKQRRPVLTMTMNDPQAELQGLTKPPKEGKKLTPFGSRASSRAPSPSPSFTNLKKEAARQEAQAEGDKVVDVAAAKEQDGLKVEEESVKASSRRNSITPSEVSVRPGLASVKSSKKNRFSTMFSRSNKSKTQVDIISSIQAASKATSATTSPELSAYATPAAETPAAMSPQSAAISADSDADISPVAFRSVDLPPTTQDSRPTKSSSNGGSADASRRSSIARQDSAESKAAAPKKRPIRALLRRLSSFNGSSSGKAEAKEAAKQNNAKANFPDAATMPVVDMDKIKQLSENPDATLEDVTVGNEVETKEEHGLAPRLQDLDLSNASPVPVNEEMAKNGFGTRSAYKLGSSTSIASAETKQALQTAVAEDTAVSPPTTTATPSTGISTEEEAEPQIARSDSHTPSSEDSFFLGANSSRPGSGTGGLMKHGSESAISEELHTPDPSTAHLPASMGGLMGNKETDPVVTSVPADDEQPVALV